jgi:hypothetical protein
MKYGIILGGGVILLIVKGYLFYRRKSLELCLVPNREIGGEARNFTPSL